MKMKGLKVVREEIKQRIKAKVGKITRYQNRLRWLPRVITNIVLIERELENET